jgi:hypothetical protein
MSFTNRPLHLAMNAALLSLTSRIDSIALWFILSSNQRHRIARQSYLPQEPALMPVTLSQAEVHPLPSSTPGLARL